MHSRNNREYSLEFKLEAITRYETSECSYRQLALALGLTNHSMIANWRRQYREKDLEGLLPHKRGRPVTKKDDRNQASKSLTKKVPLDVPTREASENRIKEFEAENRKLTILKMFWEQLRSLKREEAIPWTDAIRVERTLYKTKSSKRNAYSIKSNFMGSLYSGRIFCL